MINRDAYIGQQIGNYRLVDKIACGSFGCVYRAEHTRLKNRAVAIKLLNAPLASHEQHESFMQEADLMAMLDHPHILPVLDAGTHNGFPYLITEYCPNGSLRDRLKRQPSQPLPLEEALTILEQIAEALQFAHEQNIIHRDLKPENILFNAKGAILLADFGIAKMLDTVGIRQGTAIGTPAYMAPEQFRGLSSRESDQYALGCIAYELFTGKQPFVAPDMASLMFKHLMEQPVAPKQLNAQLPAHIEQAILKALAKERADRYEDITSFTKALRKTAEQWLDEGYALLEAEQYEEALIAHEQALRLNPNDVVAYHNKAIALHELKRYEEALLAYEQAIRLNPNNANVYNNKGITLEYFKRYKEALEAYVQAIRLNPSFADAYNNKGDVLKQLGRTQEAQQAYEKARQLGYKG